VASSLPTPEIHQREGKDRPHRIVEVIRPCLQLRCQQAHAFLWVTEVPQRARQLDHRPAATFDGESSDESLSVQRRSSVRVPSGVKRGRPLEHLNRVVRRQLRGELLDHGDKLCLASLIYGRPRVTQPLFPTLLHSPAQPRPAHQHPRRSLPKRSALILRKTPIPITKTGVFLEINRMSGTAAAASPALSTIRVQVLRRRAEQTVQRVGLRVTVTAAHAGRRQRRSSTMSISVALDSTLCNPHSKLCIGD
jgi:hypothetical protein